MQAHPATKANRKGRLFQLPAVEIGAWSGEFAGVPRGSTGQVVQPGPPLLSVEFTYIVVGASVVSPISRFRWPAIVTFMVPTPMKTDLTEAGFLFRSERSPTLNLSLEVTRLQFSDLCVHFHEKRLQDFHFTVEPEVDRHWPLHSWGAAFEL
jgi:hypothetical protein